MPNPLVTYLKLHKISILLALISLAFYYTFAYHLERTDFIKLISLFIGLFILCFKLIQFEKWNFKFLLIIGIFFRLVFLILEPNLSQDFYRFIWDGQLVAQGINPYLYTPDTIMEKGEILLANGNELYSGMGSLSRRHFSNYPPLNQLIFAFATMLGGKNMLGSIVVMRIIIMISDIGIIYFGRKLLKNLNLSPHLIFWYFLNPLVIIELTGNLHFEGVMLFFFILSMYLLSIKKWMLAILPYAFSILVKLVPLLFLPLFLKYLGVKKTIVFYVVVGVVSVVFLLPFYADEFITNYAQTVGLWFSNFEFNASIYNVVKKIALQYDTQPWELIKTYGKITPYITIAVVLLFTFFGKNQKLQRLLANMLWVLTIYYMLSSTIHPWYVIFLILLTVFTEFRFALFWSAIVILSYYAYSQTDFKENLWLLAVEYISIIGFMCYEIFKFNKQKPFFQKNSRRFTANSN